MPVVSVVTACLPSRADHIDRLHETISAQTVSDAEWIVVMDGPHNWEPKVLPNVTVRVVANDTCRGAAWSRNRGVTLAGSRYVRMMDADDYFSTNHVLEDELKVIDELGVSYVTSRMDDLVDGIRHRFGEDHRSGIILPGQVQRKVREGGKITDVIPAAPTSLMVSRSAFMIAGGYPAVEKHEDALFLLKLSDLFPGYYDDDCHGIYRREAGSLSSAVAPAADNFYQAVVDYLQSDSIRR